MPYRRGGFALTPPSLLIFFVSLSLFHLPWRAGYHAGALRPHAGAIINASHVFDLLAIACVVLTIGVLF
jgi:hypothetical protein